MSTSDWELAILLQVSLMFISILSFAIIIIIIIIVIIGSDHFSLDTYIVSLY